MRGARAADAALDRDPPLVPRLRPLRGAAPARGAAPLSPDARSRRVAVVADSRLEGLLDELRAEEYGVIQLPPAELGSDDAAGWLEQVAEHVAEFRRTGYEVVLADDGTHTDALSAALAEVGVAALPQYETR